ncbi:ATP-binding protein [Haloterrigena longa]|uniref:ATP-binding protein n=1 Tax=Natrinema longum TaxID=370324 RepID=A0A8A2UDX6_9EURY|nr:ATP-binding protein [Natrinema longum]QSW86939.1 ATP-binding protein [Natrinema longum]
MTVIGASGSGKSYYTGALLEDRVPNFDIAVHFDLEDEEGGLSVEGNALYGTLVVDKDRFESIDWPKCLFNHRKLRVVPDALDDEEIEELYGQICEAAMSLCKDLEIEAAPESALVSCDEAHQVLSKHSLDSRVNRMQTGGRKHGVETIHLAQRPALMPLTILSQSDRRIYFHVSEQRDIDKINKASTFDADRLKNLQAREAIVENKHSGEFEKIDTDNCDRERPHFSGDDGILDDALPV